MSGYITDRHAYFLVTVVIRHNKIVIITAGFITINAFAGYIESVNFQIAFRKKVLLNLHSQV